LTAALEEIDPRDYLYQKDETIFEKTYERWTQDWWNWLVGIEKDRNPAVDPSGVFQDQAQPSNKVFFLAGQMYGKATRRVTIPKGMAILTSPVCVEWSYPEMQGFMEPDEKGGLKITNKSKEGLIGFTKDHMDDMYSLEVVIAQGTTGELAVWTGELSKYRIQTDSFKITFSPNNIFNTLSGKTDAAADGFWLFLRPNVLEKIVPEGNELILYLHGVTARYDSEVIYHLTFGSPRG
jgi:hypothetical protein